MQKNATPDKPYTIKYDLTNCEEEPIHLIQTIQSFACLLAADSASLVIDRLSSNTSAFLNKSPEELLGQPLHSIFKKDVIKLLQKGVTQQSFSEINPIIIPCVDGEGSSNVIVAHLKGNDLILEIEESSSRDNSLHLLHKIDTAIQRIQSATVTDNLFSEVAQQVKNITDYDRVMIYRFDTHYNGEVVAESKADHLEPFLGIRYPASDIPKQARELFLTNRVRLLVDVDDELAMIQSVGNNKLLDVGSSASRGVSPIHLEYLRNMGVKATLNVAIVEDEKLWGLISCHHYEDRMVLDYPTRNLVKFIGQVISGHLSISRAKEYREGVLQQRLVHANLFENISKEQDVLEGLSNGKYNLLDYISSEGAAIVFDRKIKTFGDCPDKENIMQIVDWLNTPESIVFTTESMLKEWPDSTAIIKNFSGLLAVKLSEDNSEYLLWFRKPQEKEVTWGGDPNNTVTLSEETGRLTPRKSFAKWKEVVKSTSRPWTKLESDAALLLRNDIKDILLRRFRELKKLHQDLHMSYKEMESFSYTVSHDLRSPLRGIEGFAQILLEDYSEQLDSYGIQVVNTIVNGVGKMNAFINDILSLSKTANQHVVFREINMMDFMVEIIEESKIWNKPNHPISVRVEGSLPNLYGDPTMIRQLFTNLINNAVKYSRPIEDAAVVVSAKDEEEQTVYKVEDNGIGFDMKFANKIFEVFSRLVGEDDYEGTGIGLSIVNRIVKRHEGKIRVESVPEKGTVFFITLPKRTLNNEV